jgi:hypothetical protein
MIAASSEELSRVKCVYIYYIDFVREFSSCNGACV